MTTAPCHGQSYLFDSRDYRTHLEAKAICATCPMFKACERHLEDVIEASVSRGGPEGTWAGRLMGGRLTNHGAAQLERAARRLA